MPNKMEAISLSDTIRSGNSPSGLLAGLTARRQKRRDLRSSARAAAVVIFALLLTFTAFLFQASANPLPHTDCALLSRGPGTADSSCLGEPAPSPGSSRLLNRRATCKLNKAANRTLCDSVVAPSTAIDIGSPNGKHALIWTDGNPRLLSFGISTPRWKLLPAPLSKATGCVKFTPTFNAVNGSIALSCGSTVWLRVSVVGIAKRITIDDTGTVKFWSSAAANAVLRFKLVPGAKPVASPAAAIKVTTRSVTTSSKSRTKTRSTSATRTLSRTRSTTSLSRTKSASTTTLLGIQPKSRSSSSLSKTSSSSKSLSKTQTRSNSKTVGASLPYYPLSSLSHHELHVPPQLTKAKLTSTTAIPRTTRYFPHRPPVALLRYSQFTNATDHRVTHVDVDWFGNIYFVGVFKDALEAIGQTTLQSFNASNYALIVAKLDKDFQPVWALEFGSVDGQATPSGLAVYRNTGSVYVAATSGGFSLTVGSYFLEAQGPPGFSVLFKISTTGSVVWARTLAQTDAKAAAMPGSPGFVSELTYGAGALYMAGTFKGSYFTLSNNFDLTKPAGTISSGYWAKFDPANGEVVAADVVGSEASQNCYTTANSIQVASTGQIFLLGHYACDAHFGTTTLVNGCPDMRAYIASFYDNGTHVWQPRRIGESTCMPLIQAVSLSLDEPAGRFVMGGDAIKYPGIVYYWGYDNAQFGGSISAFVNVWHDIYVIHANMSNGVGLYGTEIRGDQVDILHSVALDGYGGLYIAGETSSFVVGNQEWTTANFYNPFSLPFLAHYGERSGFITFGNPGDHMMPSSPQGAITKIATDQFGNVFAAGYLTDYGTLFMNGAPYNNSGVSAFVSGTTGLLLGFEETLVEWPRRYRPTSTTVTSTTSQTPTSSLTTETESSTTSQSTETLTTTTRTNTTSTTSLTGTSRWVAKVGWVRLTRSDPESLLTVTPAQSP